MRLTDRITNAILAHSATLQSLKIEVWVPGTLDMKNLMRILVECRQLWRMNLDGNGKGTIEELLATLASQPWGCKNLEVLSLRMSLVSPDFEMDDTSDDDDGERNRKSKEEQEEEEKAREEAKACRLSGMGWRLGEQFDTYIDEMAKKQDVDAVAGVLGLVEGLKRVKTVRWNDAKNRYALWGSELRQLALEKVQLGSVVEAGPRNPTILLPERFVVRLARHIHGGQVGVNNAQATRVQAQDLLPIPAADDEGHYRRNLLRAKFMERGVFPAEDLRFVEQYIYFYKSCRRF
ncbi:hypothetical protein BGX23_010919 [Mortierella sp. AD031]|nr:hypothetical protein BGX23_010919 [Mortierella sp. AD031]